MRSERKVDFKLRFFFLFFFSVKKRVVWRNRCDRLCCVRGRLGLGEGSRGGVLWAIGGVVLF